MSARPIVRLLLAALLTVSSLALAVGTLAPAQAATSRSIGLSVSPTAAAARSMVTFSGRLTRSPKGSLVRLQQKQASGWVLVRSTRTTTATGRYRMPTALPTLPGRYSYRVVAPAKGSLAKATSKTVTVTALEKTFVSMTASPSTIAAGTSVRLDGFVRPFTAGGRVLLQRWTGTAWSNVALSTLTSNGLFTRTIPLSATSTLRATVARSGMRAAGFSAPVKVTVTPADPGDPPAPVISTATLPAATVGTGYSTTLAAAGAATGTWTASPLPAGLTLNASTGQIHGTPTAAGTTHVVVGFTQTGNPTPATPKTLDLLVKPRPAPVISTTTLPDGKVFQKYAAQLAAGGATGTWSITGKPGWLKLDAATGALSGTPSLLDSGNVTVTIGFTETGNPTPAAPVTITFHVDGL